METKTMFCSNCGAKIQYEAGAMQTKCIRCGAELKIEQNPVFASNDQLQNNQAGWSSVQSPQPAPNQQQWPPTREQLAWEDMQARQRAEWEAAQQRRLEEERVRRAAFRQRVKRIAKITIPIVVPLIVLILLYGPVIKPGIQYYQAGNLIKQGEYSEGLSLYHSLQDSFWYNKDKVDAIRYEYGVRLLAEERYTVAEVMLKQVHPYENSAEYLELCSKGLIAEDLKRREYGSAIERVRQISAADPEFVQLANLVVDYLEEKGKHLLAIPLLDDLVELDSAYEERRNEFYYAGFFANNNLTVKLECAAALPDGYRDIASQRVQLQPYETFIATWQRDSASPTATDSFQLFDDVYFKDDAVYVKKGLSYCRIGEDNEVQYLSDAGKGRDSSYYIFTEEELVEYNVDKGKTISYVRVSQ